MNKRVRLTLILAVVSLSILFVLALAVYAFNLTAVSRSADSVPVKVEIPSGATMRTAARTLKSNDLIRSENFFYAHARLTKSRLEAGVYQITPNMSVPAILSQLKENRRSYVTVGIPEGYTIKKMAALLEKNGICEAAAFIEAASDPLLLEEYHIPAQSFQGYLFPDTYFLNLDMDARMVVRMLADTFFDHIAGIENFGGETPEKIFELVTLASIVEREYRAAIEAPLIASVFTNRLSGNIGLYSCATIEYIITEINDLPHPTIITYADLAIDNPYNTYKFAGLTPGPISNPGLVALNAAAAPAKTSYLYFRLVNQAEGLHHFSEDFDEHIEAGRIYYTK